MPHPDAHERERPGTTSGPAGGLVILGAGYTGRHLYEAARTRYRPVLVTSRSPEGRLAWAPAGSRLTFDLAREDTWSRLPREASIVWCFPASPPDLVRAFAARALAEPRRLVVLGSTSAYDVPRAEPRAGTAPALDETAPIRLDLPRVQGEECLRREHGAVVLRVAGIYGPGRSVLEWIRQGRVTAAPRMVNLVHVDDLAAVCLVALERGTPCRTYNVSDGSPRRWTDICREVEARWGIRARPAREERGPGKRIVTDRLATELGYTCRHPDLYAALAHLESEGEFRPRRDATTPRRME